MLQGSQGEELRGIHLQDTSAHGMVESRRVRKSRQRSQILSFYFLQFSFQMWGGSYELPLAAQAMIKHVDAVICVGCLIKANL